VALNGFENVFTHHAAAGPAGRDGERLSFGHYHAVEAGMFAVGAISAQERFGRYSPFDEWAPLKSVDSLGLHRRSAAAAAGGQGGRVGGGAQAGGGGGEVPSAPSPRDAVAEADAAAEAAAEAEAEGGCCRLMKVDVEGMEEEVLGGAARTIAACRPVLYLENNGHGDSGRLVALLRRLRYNLYWHQFHTRLSRAQRGGYKETNLICVPAESERDNAAVRDAGIYPQWEHKEL
jgi:hypothetical protein